MGSKWKDWNGIPAQIVLGAGKLFSKCLKHRSGPGSAAPSLTGACHLAQAFEDLQAAESSLTGVDVQAHLIEAGFNCSEAPATLVATSGGDSPLAPAMSESPRGGANDDGGNASIASSPAKATSYICMLFVLVACLIQLTRTA